MKLLRGSQSDNSLKNGSVVTIGNFDGVHRGHQALLLSLKNEAIRRKLPFVVVLFEPQPNEFFSKEEMPARLTTLREKWDVLKTLGVDYVYCLRFNHSIANLSAEAFAEHLLFSILHARMICIGPDFRFGRGRCGDQTLLENIGRTHACAVTVCPDLCVNNTRVSSTLIRKTLAAGLFDTASNFLGRPYSISGRVVRGEARGRQWGIPTANIHLARKNPALAGVYFVQVTRKNKPNTSYYGVANLGKRPTVDGFKLVLEVHLFEFDGSLYDERLDVVFLKVLRSEQTFLSVDALIAQIRLDISQARAMIPQFTA